MKKIHYTAIGRLLLSFLIIGSLSQLSANPKIEKTIEEVLQRQAKKGDVLNVYLKNARGTYVNGKQISLEILQELIPRAKVSCATISSEPHVTQGRVPQMMELVQKSGLSKIQLTQPKQ